MPTETLITGTEMTEAEARELIMRKKEEAAEGAATVADFNSRFKSSVDDVLRNPHVDLEEGKPAKSTSPVIQKAYGDGASAGDSLASEILKREAQKHVVEAEEVSKGKEGIKLMKSAPTHLGKNEVGGGDGNMELNADLFARLDGGKGQQVENVDQTFHHESAHGRQADAPIEWQEGHAEVTSAEKIGKGADYRRPGQPTKLYKEGQDTVVAANRIIGRAKVEEGMTKDFGIIIRELMASEDPEAKAMLRKIAASN